jgi:hypothetical protein
MLSPICATFWLATSALGTASQEPQPAPPTPTPPPVVAPSDKPALVPGAVPADASPQAREAWLAMVKATAGETPQPKVVGFDLYFEGRARPVGRESHDFDDARYRYREPGWIHTTLQDGSERLRGPRGDWFVKDGVATRLQGADFANDTRELDDQARIAASFVNLVDLRALRLQSLALASAPPASIPASVLEAAKKDKHGKEVVLRWLEAVSPDFDRSGKDKDQPVRAWIGVDARTNLPVFALVARDDRGTIVHESALLVKLGEWAALDGFQVPQVMHSYEPDLSKSPWSFTEGPSLSLWLKLKSGGTLRPSLTEADFTPPQKR